jgi:hypothetical protein
MVLHQNNSLFSSRFSPPAKDATLRYLQKFSQEVKILTVKTSKDTDFIEKEMQTAAMEYASTLPKLVRLDVGGGTIWNMNLVRSLLRLKHLRHLNVDVSYQVLEQEFNHSSPSILTLQLDIDHVRSDEMEKLVCWCPGIQSLSLNLPVYETCMTLDDAFLLALAKGLPHLRILRILYARSNETDIQPEVCLSPGGVLRFAKLRGRDLVQLSLHLPSNFTLNHFQDLLASCPNLLETYFWFDTKETDPAMRSALDFVLPQTKMKHVTMTHMPSAWVGPITRSIAATVQTLSLPKCVGLTLTQIMGVVNECSSLEDLRLHLCCCRDGLAMKSKGRVAVGGGSQTLKHLSLQFCDNDVALRETKMARKVLKLCPGVIRMTFLRGTDVCPLALLLDRLPCLEELELYESGLEDRSLRSAPETGGDFPHLKSITFKRCKKVSDCLLAAMAELSPRLSHLFVDCNYPYLIERWDAVPSFSGLRRLLGRVETKKCPLILLRK